MAQIFISVAINYSIVVLGSLLALKSQCVGLVWTVVISLCVGLSGCFTGPLNDASFCRNLKRDLVARVFNPSVQRWVDP